MKVNQFEEIIAWKKARELTKSIYRIFHSSRDYAFRDQIQRATISIMNNIAEGFERRGDKEFKQFLFIAKGSCGEVRSMCYVAYDLKYITTSEFQLLSESTIEISKILSGFIKTL